MKFILHVFFFFVFFFFFFINRVDWHSLCSVKNFTIHLYEIINNTFSASANISNFIIFITLKSTYVRIPSVIFFAFKWCFISFLQFCWHLLLLYFRFELHFLQSNLNLKLHKIYFINIFDSSISVIILVHLSLQLLFNLANIFYWMDRQVSVLRLHLSELAINL